VEQRDEDREEEKEDEVEVKGKGSEREAMEGGERELASEARKWLRF